MFEDQVCTAAPFDAKAMLPNLMQVAAFIAGFALAAFVLLLDRSNDDDGHGDDRGKTIGALLLALAAIVGLVSAYVFASSSGDHCLNSRIQFLGPTALMAIAALLMVSGISATAATNPRLAATASSLRVMVVLAAVVICARFVQDYLTAEATVRRYDDLVATVEELQGPDALPASSTAGLDSNLRLYAADRWPGREEEWPGLLAEQLFGGPTSEPMAVALVGVGAMSVCGALVIRARMRRARRSSMDDGGTSAAELAADGVWRTWLSRLVILGVVTVVTLFSLSAGSGELTRPPPWHFVVVFGVVTAALGMVTQPPLVGEQSSLIDTAMTWFRRRRTPPPPAGSG